VSLDGLSTAPAGQQVQLSLSIDLTGVPGPCGSSSNAVLGGYVVPVKYDPHFLKFVGASACSSPQFRAAPTTTDASSANATGQVVITAVQTSSSAPTGASRVATLNFETVATGFTKAAPGGAMSLSSAFQSCSGVLADPVLLPARATGVALQLVGAIPTLGEPGLIALALTLCFLGARVLRRRASAIRRSALTKNLRSSS
jgi:hypothetical protein